MEDSRTLRPRRRSRRSAPKRWRQIFATIVGVTVLAALASLIGLLDSLPDVKSPVGRDAGAGVRNINSPTALVRGSYNHSVIPGGAFDQRELASAVNLDPVVAEHYRDVDATTMRPVVLTSDRLAYVSYRLGDRVYWTSKKVRIRSGETILTNGQTEIRARCGNCISMEPLLPTAADEPDLMELDALTDTGPVLVSWPLNPFGPLAMGGPVGVDTQPVTAPQLGPLFPFVASAFPFGSTGGGGPIGTSPEGSSPGPFGPNPVDGTTPPATVNPPLIGGLIPGTLIDNPYNPVNPFNPGNPGNPGNPSEPVNPRDGGPPDQPVLPPEPPPNPTAVPEPATLLLLGGGLAGLAARRWRSRSS